MKNNKTTTPGIDEEIKKIFERFKKSLDFAELVREITEVQKELLTADSHLSLLPPEHNFSHGRQQKEWSEYLDSFWGTD